MGTSNYSDEFKRDAVHQIVVRGYRRRLGRLGGKPAVVAENKLEQRFEASAPDLFSRRVVGWSAQSRVTTDLAPQALPMAVWRRKPADRVTVHSNQGSQLTSREWPMFPHQRNLEPSTSRRGNCHDNAVAESFFQLLKRDRIRRRTYPTRNDAGRDVFEYIELFYNPNRKHTNNGILSPVDFEIRQFKLKQAGVQESRGTSAIGVVVIVLSQFHCSLNLAE